jgi:formylglycine-generating enzyme required for sulfatase activity/rhodanese-related sulfurtransferase/chromosome segregation ATPase
MRAAKKITVDKKLLQEFVPLNALSAGRFREVSEKIVIEEVLAGRYLFHKGDRDNQSIYLLEGKINLIDEFRKVTSEVEAGTDMSRYAISNQQPRPLSARAVNKCIIARIDSALLDVYLTWDQSNSAEVVEIGADENQDWMTRILQTEAFIKIPPAMIQSLLIKMQSYPVKAGDVVIRQGDAGDYFYTIHEGRCAVTRKESPDADAQFLAELDSGASFGEDALVSDKKRNATVTMLTNGLLMRLAKEDFIELLKKQLVKHVDYEQAATLVDEGAVWVDVRTVDEYECGAFEDSVNMPLSNLRNELSELVFNTKYIICCDTGRRSESAGFLLSHHGFDVYVLEGGIPGPAPDVASVTDKPALYIADTGDDSHAAADNTVAEQATAESDDRLVSLRAENEELLAEIKKYQSVEVRMAEQIDQLRGELGESGDKLGVLYAKASTDAEQFEQLRGELGESGEKLGVLYAQVKSDSEAMQLLRDQYVALQEQHTDVVNAHKLELEELGKQLNEMQLQADVDRQEHRVLEQEAASGQAAQQEIQQLQEALNKAGERVSELESEVVKSDAAGSALLDESEIRLQEQQDLLAQLQEELSAASQAMAGYQEAASAREAEREASEAELQERLQQQTGLSGKLQEELESLQQEVKETVEKLGQESGQTVALEEENATLLRQLEEVRSEADAGKQELETALTVAKEQHQVLEQQLEVLQASFEQQLQDLSAVSEDKEQVAGAVQALQQDNEKLRTELRETALLLGEQNEDVGNQLAAARQAAEEALQKQQAEWETERDALHKAATDEQQVVEALRKELEQLQASAEESRAGLEKEQQEQLDKAREQIERLESQNEKLGNERASHTEELELATTERGQLQQLLQAANEDKSRLEGEVEALKDQVSGLADSAAADLQLVQEQLEAEQSRATGLEQSGSDRDVQIRDLQQEILQSGEARSALEQAVESLRQQHEDSQLQLEQQSERTRELEQEHNESIQKAHEDLTRKNDNEKELQGQIDRLRKKLEQSTVDLKAGREGLLADVDHLRDELHAERQARAEERAEMAARQRELKEQLTEIALEHEAKLTNQSGAIEQARHDGRKEEQAQLRDLIEAQGQSEEQVLALQNDLQKAHAEIAELSRLEKDRRQVDVEMMQEQNQQAVSTITQLESQLKQLTLDRDAALAEQQTIREKMNTLRGEVEVARGLMNVGSQGHVEDPGKLRHELDESKKNMAIALRLRAEAEAARDKLIEERNALQEKLGEEATAGAPLRMPSLDPGEAGGGHPEPQRSTAKTAAPTARTNSVARDKDSRQPSLVAVDRDRGQRRWLGAAIGLGVVGAVALVAWLLIGSGNPLSSDNEVHDMAVVEADNGSAEKPVAPEAAASQPAKATKPPAEVQQPVIAVTAPAPVAAKPIAEVVPENVAPAPARVTAVRAFQDGLKGGSKGPVMVELPTAGYLMGSPGNSLNFDEGPRHQVNLSGFSISKHEVTFAEYDKFARATGRRMPYDESWGRADRPVINVSWNDARAYADWLSKKTGKNYRLPTEAEWEYAARAGSTANIWWDNSSDVKQANCFNCGSEWDGKRTAPAGTFEANDFGLYDMAGNAQEWTEDCYHTGYTGAPDDGSAWLTAECTQRVVRGGSYSSPLDSLRNARRGQYDQDTRLDNIGFRVVRSN